ncbi:hypothetical protein B0H14DRAFT_3554406 [Mycena olivaceomarginata]|nr:hypothetical protein B0H14DRAFT_3554406 [Mycena olivaceomarginata]
MSIQPNKTDYSTSGPSGSREGSGEVVHPSHMYLPAASSKREISRSQEQSKEQRVGAFPNFLSPTEHISATRINVESEMKEYTNIAECPNQRFGKIPRRMLLGSLGTYEDQFDQSASRAMDEGQEGREADFGNREALEHGRSKFYQMIRLINEEPAEPGEYNRRTFRFGICESGEPEGAFYQILSRMSSWDSGAPEASRCPVHTGGDLDILSKEQDREKNGGDDGDSLKSSLSMKASLSIDTTGLPH